MKRSLFVSVIIIVGLFYSCSHKGVDGEIIDGNQLFYYESGAIEAKIPLNDKGQKEGIAEYYYENSVLKQTSTFMRDTLNGEMKKYYPSGMLQNISHFKNGLGDGEAIEYYENGNVHATGIYSMGKQNGRFITYYENTLPQFDYVYENDHRISYVEYDEGGAVKSRSIDLTATMDSNRDLVHASPISVQLKLDHVHPNADSTKAFFTLIGSNETKIDTVVVRSAMLTHDLFADQPGRFRCVIEVVEWINPKENLYFIARDTLNFVVK